MVSPSFLLSRKLFSNTFCFISISLKFCPGIYEIGPRTGAYIHNQSYMYFSDTENDGRVTLGHDRSRLHQAATMGQLLMLHALIEDGAKVNVTTYNGVTPLHDACSTGHRYSARCLIKAGGKVLILQRFSWCYAGKNVNVNVRKLCC